MENGLVAGFRAVRNAQKITSSFRLFFWAESALQTSSFNLLNSGYCTLTHPNIPGRENELLFFSRSQVLRKLAKIKVLYLLVGKWGNINPLYMRWIDRVSTTYK
ncbi:MAG: hypothetical protein D6730_13775 [Bacteroidetes bacterium]|nr:MAG: hypothetical protein D6730_13775 [Bacteroidota bacterium]